MEFWGVEVKPGETVKCEPGDDKYIHLSQASLGETKKPNENVPLYVKCGDKKLVVGTLSGDKCAQIQHDLVFEKEFELSHGSKNTSVHFLGYKTIAADEPDDMFEDMSDESDGEEEPIEAVPIKAPAVNGKAKSAEKAKADGPKKAEAAKPKQEDKAKKSKNEKDDEDDSDESDDEEDDSEDDEDSDEEPKELKMMELDSDDDEDDDDDDDDEDDDEDDSDEEDEEEEATPQKNESKKRALKDGQKTPQESKKAKVVSPAGAQKTDGKKSGHVATPHPAKQAPKTPAATNDKAKQKVQTPKSGGSVTCKSCSKTFNSENALQSHTKAKHA